VSPELFLASEEEPRANVGDVVTVPFTLRNASAAGRDLAVLNVFKNEGRLDRQPVPLNWETLHAGRERKFSVVTEPLESGGAHRLGLTIVVAARTAAFEEHYALSSEVLIQVAAGSGPTQIVQNFDLSNSDFGTAGMVVANPNLQQRSSEPRAPARRPEERLALERAERFELEAGYRGYAATGYRIPRNAVLEYRGFPSEDAPLPGPLTGARPSVRCGRNSRRHDAERNPSPNDLCLRAYDDGGVDADTSRAVSRHLCELFLQNDRLHVRALESARLEHNGEAMGANELRVVQDGDRLRAPAGHPRAFTITAAFVAATGIVERVILQRQPGVSN